MAQPGKAPLGATYPINIAVSGGSYTVPPNQQAIDAVQGDLIAVTVAGGNCELQFQGFPLGVQIPSGATVTFHAAVLNGTVYWGPGPYSAAPDAQRVQGTPYHIKIGSGIVEPK